MTDRSVKDTIIETQKASFLSYFLFFTVTFRWRLRLIYANQIELMTVGEYNKAVDAYADSLYRFVLKNLRDSAMAEDIIQDTFEKLWMKLEEVSALKVKSYLFTTAYHTMIDYIRKEKRNVFVDPANLYEGSEADNYSDLGEVLERAVKNLPADQKAVVMLRDYEGYSYKEIAEITGLSEAQVKVYIYRARVYLKAYIGTMEKVI